jgi:hypothetical protein
MASEADQVLHAADEPIIDENKSTSRVESNALASSSSNIAIMKMVNKTTPSISDYWKKLTITEDDHFAYHATGWLSGGLESHPYCGISHGRWNHYGLLRISSNCWVRSSS